MFVRLIGADSVPPLKMIPMLNDLFSQFDQILLSTNLEKIKTIGTVYMVVGGDGEKLLIADNGDRSG